MRSWVQRAAVVAMVAAAGLGLWWLSRGANPATDTQIDRAQILGAIAGVIGVVLAVPAVLASWPRHRRPRTPGPVGAAQLVEAEARLAEETLTYWRTQAHDRGITTPATVKVTWAWADEGVAAPAEDLRVTAPRLLTSGVVTDLVDMYRQLPADRRRLVLLGGPGVGKTGAMLLLLLNLLEHRSGRDLHSGRARAHRRRGREPVPVWLTLGSWNPEQVGLLTWAAEALRRSFPALNNPELGGPAAAGELLRTGRIGLFLDGLDEMPAALRGPALAAIDRDAGDMPVVLTSRPEEFAAALRAGRLHGTATIQLLPLDPHRVHDQDSITEFLLADQIGPHRTAWQHVTDYLHTHPDSVAARTLTTPLALTLARDTYTPRAGAPAGNPRDLIDGYADADALLRHLLGRFLQHAYPNPDECEHALRWLTWIALHMNIRPTGPTHDLAWWQIPTWVGLERILPITVGLGVGFLGLIAAVLASWLGFQLIGWVGMVGFLALAMPLAFLLEPGEPRTLDLRRPTRSEWISILQAGLVGLGVGLVLWLVVLLVLLFFALLRALGVEEFLGVLLVEPPGERAASLARFASSMLVIPFGGFLGAVERLTRVWTTPVTAEPVATPLSSYRADLRYLLAGGLTQSLVMAPAFGLLLGFPFGTAGLWVGLGLGLVWGLMSGIGPGVNVAVAQILVRDRVRFLPLLEQALERQVLRQAGPMYQFRHAALQEYLTKAALREYLAKAALREYLAKRARC